MPQLLVAHHRPGFYMRVLTEAAVEAGDEIVQTAAGPHRITVAEADALLYLPHRDVERLRLALDVPALSPGWQASFRELIAAADGGSTAGSPGWSGFRPMRVVDVVAESSTVSSIRLAAVDGSALPAALPGQYLTVRVAGAADPAPVRNYSLSSAPGAATYRLSVKREDRGLVSGYLHTALRPGAVLDAAAPRGEFVLADGDAPVLLISAGIGVTPVLAMLHHLVDHRSAREVRWIHTARRPAEHAFAREARDLLGNLPNAREHIFYSAAPADELGNATAGRPTLHALDQLGLSRDAAAYVCGPAAFMNDMRSALDTLGLADQDIRTELFGALGAITPGVTGSPHVPPHQPPGPAGTGSLVTFARSGLAARFDTTLGSVLELADACDVPTRWSCRTGVCHTCATTLLSGEVTNSPEPLEPPGAGRILICCARPSTDLVLDM